MGEGKRGMGGRKRWMDEGKRRVRRWKRGVDGRKRRMDEGKPSSRLLAGGKGELLWAGTMSGEPPEPIPKTPWRRYFAGPAVGVACVLVVALVAWWRGCPPDPPRPAAFVADEAGVDLAASTPVEFGGRKGWLVGGKVVLDPADAGARDE